MAERLTVLDTNETFTPSPSPIQQPIESSSSRRLVDRLYEIYEKLNAATDKGTLKTEYKELLQAVHDDVKEKSLALQFIMRFSEYFPTLEMATANALFDLCEDEDVAVRKQAVKDLVIVCRRLPNLVPTVADVFAQILQTDSSGELNALHNSLISLLDIDPEGAIRGIFAQIKIGEPIVKQRCFEFFHTIKYNHLCAGGMNPVVEKVIWEEGRNLLKIVDSSEQFVIVKDMLMSTKMVTTEEGRQAIPEMIESMLNTRKNYETHKHDGVGKLLIAVDFVFQFFNEKNNSGSFFKYFCFRVLPNIKHIAETNENEYFAVLRMTVDLFLYVGTMEKNEVMVCLKSLLDVTEDFLFNENNVPESASGDDGDGMIPSYNFSFLESLFYLINQLSLLYPAFVSEELKSRTEFRSKVAYLLRAVVPYQSKVRNELSGLTMEKIKTENVKILMLRVLANIGSIGTAFYTTVVPYSGRTRLSWKAKTLQPAPPPIPSPRRKVTIVKRSRVDASSREDRNKRIYQPPNGKFSQEAFRSDNESPRLYRIRRSGPGRRRDQRYY